MRKDIFREYIENSEKTESEYRKIASTASSYKNVDHSIKNVNTELATYGDALLKHALCKVLFEEKVAMITEEKKKYESDEVLVRVVARNYKLLKYINFDNNDTKIPNDYDYKKNVKKSKDSLHKYIATTVEALLAAIYLDNKEDFKLIVDIVRGWKKLIGNDKNSKNG